jgi:hypothetical protein
MAGHAWVTKFEKHPERVCDTEKQGAFFSANRWKTVSSVHAFLLEASGGMTLVCVMYSGVQKSQRWG